jgi:hypothetical protein
LVSSSFINNAERSSRSKRWNKITPVFKGKGASDFKGHLLTFNFRRRYVAIRPVEPISQKPSAIRPYDYTDGHWLHHDRIQCQARHLWFDFYALCERVIEQSPKAQRIVSRDKKEGGFNRVFVFSLDNGERLVARIPFSIAGPARCTTSSEVATIDYRE